MTSHNFGAVVIGYERFWGSRYENIAPLDIGSGQGLEIILQYVANLLK